MLKPMAGVSYSNLRWERGAEHQGQLPERVCGGNPEEEQPQPQLSLFSQRKTSQGSHPEHLRQPQRSLSQEMHQKDLNNTGPSTHREILLYKQAPASGDDRISMILSVHTSSKL